MTRPNSVPKPLMFQGWQSLTFLHWRYRPDALKTLLPRSLELDTFDGTGWIGVTPFRVASLRPPALPSLPWISSFPETNVRTYVRGPGGERGIWFFTLEADRLLAVLGARAVYGLPYHWANMHVHTSGESVEYESSRFWPRGHVGSRISIRIGEPIRTSDLEKFLTSRFRPYTVLRGHLAYADVEHEPWPLHKAQAIMVRQNLIQGSGVPEPEGEPLAHYSPGVYVRVGRPVLQR